MERVGGEPLGWSTRPIGCLSTVEHASYIMDAPPFQQRRLHLQVGADAFLPATLRIFNDASGGTEWFSEEHLQDLMVLLHAEVSKQLPPLLAQRTPSRTVPTSASRGSLSTILTLLPTTSATWLVSHGSGQAQGGGLTSSALAAVPYTLLCDVEPREPARQQRQTTLESSVGRGATAAAAGS